MKAIEKSRLSQLSDFVAARLGLSFPRDRWGDLQHGIEAARGKLGFKNAAACLDGLLSSSLNQEQIEILAGFLTIGETYFMRDKHCFELLEKEILSSLIQSRGDGSRQIRIWSAGCATGEEPYSIAILLDRLIPDWNGWNISLLATDLNRNFLEIARSGIYSEWSFRDFPPELREKYFRKAKGGRLEIIPRIRERVAFGYHNLVQDVFPSLTNSTNGMDLILCRNVLIYFVPEQSQKVIRHFYSSLAEGGALVVSPCEASFEFFSQFTPVRSPEMTYYRRDGKKVSSAPPPPTFVPPVFSVPFQEKKKPAAPSLSHREMARALANEGKLAEAQEWSKKAIADEKLNPAAYYMHAMILQELGKMEEAVSFLKKELYLDPDFILAHFALGNIARIQKREEEAQKHFETALSLLKRCQRDAILPESEGMTAGRLGEIIVSLVEKEQVA